MTNSNSKPMGGSEINYNLGLMFTPAFLSGAASAPGGAAVVVMLEDECCDVANCEDGPHNCVSWTDPETGKPVKCKKGGSEECEQ